jgi:hypothetical protein
MSALVYLYGSNAAKSIQQPIEMTKRGRNWIFWDMMLCCLADLEGTCLHIQEAGGPSRIGMLYGSLDAVQ